ncbi:MAG: hypothetical protein K8S13_24595 [Desulfobacula sp.]|uniref:AAA family ATPase n=1 Tax=Desulfobacula sp. TaxID=2593537 RepID=UPI0025B888E6|nr:ATP-binding protein [Desulfobacula sp.]MCD4723009.1 hypothetical protein [Desulfobacula sp.]
MDPFKFGQVVSGSDFCPRPELLQTVMTYINQGQNMYVQGERRIGKTSLIYEACCRLKKFRVIYVDLFGVKSSDILAKRIVKAIISMEQKESGVFSKIFKTFSYLRPSFSIDPITGLPSVSLDATVKMTPDDIETVLDLISAIKTAKKPVLVIFDEFQDVLNIKDADETLAMMRSKIQFQSDITYIFAGSLRNKMDEIFIDSDSPFFKSAVLVAVGPLTETAFKDYIIKRFKNGGRTIKEDILDRIFEIAGDIAGDIQQFCSALWTITSTGDSIEQDNIPKALELIFARESKVYEADIETISEQQFICLIGIAGYGGKELTSSRFLMNIGIPSSASVLKALARLIKLRIIFKSGNEYKFTNPFFRAWLLYKNF